MKNERVALVQQVLDNYPALLLVDEAEGSPPVDLSRLLDRLSTRELRAVLASFSLLAKAVQPPRAPAPRHAADYHC